jgi:serine/threonine protein kinase
MALSPVPAWPVQIVEPIGSGGMGEVYRARDLRLGRDVALKVMASHIASDAGMRRRFETEARAIASLSHPSILGIHELAVVDGVPVAVMELLQGRRCARACARAVPARGR